MVRYAIALRGEPNGAGMVVEERVVNLHRSENISEWYLTTVNRKGQVPSMTSSTLAEPLTESLEITFLIAKFYPNLIPHLHKATIEQLLRELHAIQPLSLSSAPLGPDEQTKGVINEKLDNLLAGDDISSQWRSALEFKKNFYDQTLRYALNTDAVEKAKVQITTFFHKLQDHMSGNCGWILGGPSATALDAHSVPYIARLMEAGYAELVPPDIQEYAAWAMARPEWQSLMQGRPTLWNVYLRDHLIPSKLKREEISES